MIAMAKRAFIHPLRNAGFSGAVPCDIPLHFLQPLRRFELIIEPGLAACLPCRSHFDSPLRSADFLSYHEVDQKPNDRKERYDVRAARGRRERHNLFSLVASQKANLSAFLLSDR